MESKSCRHRGFQAPKDWETPNRRCKEVINDNVRTVRRAEVFREGDSIVFLVEADGFLYNMVRIMAGTLLAMETGQRASGSIPAILEARDRSAAGKTAPACGLYLHRVFYEDREDIEWNV